MEAVLVEGSALEQEWQQLVDSPGSGAQVQHTLEWKRAVSEAYATPKPAYYIARNGGGNLFGLAAFAAKSFLLGNRLVSTPFVDHGGFVGTPNAAGVAEILSQVKKNFGFEKSQVRLASYAPNFSESEKSLLASGFFKKDSKQVAVLELSSQQAIWDGFSRHVRKNVNKAERSGLQVRELDSQKELDAFYAQYFASMKQFGTPCHSKKFFESLLAHLGAGRKFFGFNCYSGAELAGSILMFVHGKNAILPFGVSSPQFREFRPNDLLHWEAIKRAVEMGVKNFDLGLAQSDAQPGTHAHGILEFKLKLGCKLFERPVYYGGYGVQASNSSGNSGTGSFRKLSGVWKHLPNAVIEKVGPWACRQMC